MLWLASPFPQSGHKFVHIPANKHIHSHLLWLTQGIDVLLSNIWRSAVIWENSPCLTSLFYNLKLSSMLMPECLFLEHSSTKVNGAYTCAPSWWPVVWNFSISLAPSEEGLREMLSGTGWNSMLFCLQPIGWANNEYLSSGGVLNRTYYDR